MNPRTIKTCVASVVGYIALETGLHSGLLAGLYQQTASVWRAEAQMKGLIPLMMIAQVCFGLFFGLIYTKGYQPGKGGLTQGLRYGALAALMLSPTAGLVWYVVLPIPQELAWAWGAGSFVQILALGALVGVVHGDR